MRVLLAGATGAIGRHLTTSLTAAGHQVVGLTRSPSAARRFSAHWADAIVADVLDPAALRDAARGHRADAVIHQLTALSRLPYRYRDLEPTNRLRTEGSRHLLALARDVGATRVVVQSFLGGYGYLDHRPTLGQRGQSLIDESRPFGEPSGHGPRDRILTALRDAEQLTRTAEGLEGIALRYGLFYGAGGPLETMLPLLRGRRLPLPRDGGGTHSYSWLPDAASATVAALEHGVPGQAYNVCDDQPVQWNTFIEALAAAAGAPRPLHVPGWLFRAAPYARDLMTSTIPMSNQRARRELDWAPRAPTYREGIAADLQVRAA